MPDDVNPIPVEVLRALVRKEGLWKPDAANALADLAAYALALREVADAMYDEWVNPTAPCVCDEMRWAGLTERVPLARLRALLGEDA